MKIEIKNGDMNKFIDTVVGKLNYNIEFIGANFHKDIRLKDTIAVFGAPRSGTTLLMNILETLPQYKSIFEPFNKNWFPQVEKLGLGCRPYVPIEKSHAELKIYLQNIFLGKTYSFTPINALSINSIYRKLSSNKLIIKFIRANRLLPWILKNFQLRCTYFILRHPCATIASQIEKGITGYYLPKNVSIPKKILQKEIEKIPEIATNIKLIKKIENINTHEEILAVIWSLDYYIPLKYYKSYPTNILIYEELLTNGNNKLKNIFNLINEKVPTEAYKKLTEPSLTTIDVSNFNLEQQLLKWKSKLSKDQMNKILNVINWFDIDFYTEELLPDHNKIDSYIKNIPTKEL